MKKFHPEHLIAILFMFPMTGIGQEPQAGVKEITSEVLNARRISNALAPQYTWFSRTEVMRKNEVLNILIEKLEYGTDGQLVKKTINEQGAKMPTTFLIRDIAEEEKQNIEKFLYGLHDFLLKYSMKEEDRVSRFIETSGWQIAGDKKEIIFTGKNLVEPGDQLTWWVNLSDYSSSKIEVTTLFEGDKITFTATFNTLKEGLNYIAYAEALIPQRNLTLQVQYYDYTPEKLE
jgi:hypothetical protein